MRVKSRSLLIIVLTISGLGDALGGVFALLDWRRAAALLSSSIPDWEPQKHAGSIAYSDDALHQLWANLGTALIALGMVQILAALWVSRDRRAGYDLARVVGWALLLAGGLMAVSVPQLSSLLTESLRGLMILALAVWARTAFEAEAPGTAGD
jgi:hypothetical protein